MNRAPAEQKAQSRARRLTALPGVTQARYAASSALHGAELSTSKVRDMVYSDAELVEAMGTRNTKRRLLKILDIAGVIFLFSLFQWSCFDVDVEL